MKFAFVSEFRHLPQKFGGVQSNTHELSLELKRRSHSVAVVAELFPSDFLGMRTRMLGKFMPKKSVHDRFLGYPTYRRWKVLESLPELMAEIEPDIAIVQPFNQVPLAREMERLSVPTIVYVHDVEWRMLGGNPRDLSNTVFISNSEFTARRFREEFSLPSTVIPPFFQADDYRRDNSGENITFVNPHLLKGSDLAMRIADACPDIPFCFVRSWELPPEQEAALGEFAKLHKNITIVGPTRKMAEIYQRARLVIMPSLLDEAWGRVASEAHFNGIPVIASDRGGLPEAVGPGGVLMDPDAPIGDWVGVIRRIWQDGARYSELSAAALAFSKRAEISPDFQIATLLEAAHRAISQRRLSRRVS